MRERHGMTARIKIYQRVLRWTALPLILLIWLMLMTGPAVFKTELLRDLVLGLLNPASAGKWHSVWLPPITALLFYVHTAMGLQMMIARARWLKPKGLWEVVAFGLCLLGLAQFFLLFYSK